MLRSHVLLGLSFVLLEALVAPAWAKEDGNAISPDSLDQTAEVMNLAGPWQFLLDGPKPAAHQERLPGLSFHDTIQLPGTTETNHKGKENTTGGSRALTRAYRFDGPAWYQREISVPFAWRGKRFALLLERTKYTQVWFDDRPCGDCLILCTPQEYVLGAVEPGVHRLTIVVDNTRRPVKGEMHQMSDNTQGNWNGLLGRLELRATDPVWLDDVQAYPQVAQKTVRVKVALGNSSGRPGKGKLTTTVQGERVAAAAPPMDVHWDASGGSAELVVPLGDSARLWSEFQPVLYRLEVCLQGENLHGRRTVTFGLREFGKQGSQFAVNGRTTFLRGKHDGCVFPLTGHPPMEVEGWLKYLRVCRDYGINHLRFHTWTPPEAAFAAADQLGMYLQPELPFWGKYSQAEQRALMPEAERILKHYGNHPSFVMLSLGNECTGSRTVMAEMVHSLRARDPRHLYAQGSNNFLWAPTLAEGDDYWTTVRVTNPAKGPIRNVRGSYATVDGANGLVQIGPPGTRNDYSTAIAGLPVPVIGHEVGQYTVYPNFREISKYTGVMRAHNLEHFRDKLAGAGMLDQADDFFRASGKLAAICYREEIEAALRTPGFGGFQLLDLQDFPGQGTALVGMLDAFMDSKGAITPDEWRQFCAPVTVLARFDKRTWNSGEVFTADVEVAHYGENDLPQAVLTWRLRDEQGAEVAAGKFPAADVRQGGLRALGKLTALLGDVKRASRLTLDLSLAGTPIATSYTLWVYPPPSNVKVPANVTLARAFDAKVEQKLAAGGRVLLVLDEKRRLSQTVGGGFTTDFWCWPMFHNAPGTMGLLCKAKHPALAGFPTEEHSDWQWFHLAVHSQPLILDGLSKDIRPVVQVIDNLDRVHRLGLIFEAKVGAGRLLVCACDVLALPEQPEARQLLASLLDYARSEQFDPAGQLPPDAAREFFRMATTVPGKRKAKSR